MAIPFAKAIELFVCHWQIKMEMKNKLEDSSLLVITLSKRSIIWLEKQHELIVNNQLFDVKQIVDESSEHITISGLYDKTEDAIWQKIDKANSPFSKKQHLISGFLKQLISNHNGLLFEFKFCKNNANTYNLFYQQGRLLHLSFNKDKPPAVV